ncbi:MAG: GNAT family N-acetyltransferase [Pararhodobacter sp.]
MDVSVVDSISKLPAAVWDALARNDPTNGAAAPGRAVHPFVSHRFLLALEESGSVGPGSGWHPRHLVMREGGRILAAMPLYLKDHSQGEYIFDHAFADAWRRAGGRYYPKLQVAVPFTPATGPRLLGPVAHHRAMLDALRDITAQNNLSSVHLTFCTEAEARLGAEAGFLHRVTQQFHWQDEGYGDFEGFLASLSSRKRKAIRKERATAQGFGGTIRALTGDQIEPHHWESFWAFYQDTGARKWGRPYLTRAFFDACHAHMRDDILLVLAERDGRAVAGALNFIGADTLYGRYWGCLEEHPCLHFELCYYQAIDWALEHGLQRVEAGAQGEHKLARGYMPSRVHSLHWFTDQRFRGAVADYLRAEGAAMQDEMRFLESFAPFRKGTGTLNREKTDAT